jgi:ribosome-binding factor A
LESAKGLLRSEVGKQTGIKFTPSLAFFADAMPENARHVEELLRKAQEDDERVHLQAAQSTYAGDVDPYRHPREVESDE